jgi:hypothetical protein
MPRTKKQISESTTTQVETTSNVEEVMPINQTIQAPMIDASLVELQIAGYTIIPPSEKLKLDEELEEPQQLTDPEPESNKLIFDVHCKGEFVESCSYGSEKLHSFLNKNEEQLQNWIEELSKPTSVEEDLALFNIPDNGMSYKSLRQYYTQNGLAPKPPRVIDWMTYYMKKHFPITPEEIAVLVKGDLDYSFIPKHS